MASGEAGVIGQRSGGDPQVGVVSGQQRPQRLEESGPGRLVGLDCCGGGAGVAVGQTIPVRSVDDPLTAMGRPGMAGEPAATVGGEGMDGDPVPGWIGVDLQLDPLTGLHQPGGARSSRRPRTR